MQDRTTELFNADPDSLNTKDLLLQRMIKNGMFYQDALAVFDLFLEQCEYAKEITWDLPANEYPLQMNSALFVSIRPYAYQWICDNKPMACFKQVFE